ncbi:MAG: NAD-dependent epimerase/dehydratase family protein [Candidatus Sungbacteria bacterium]|uniref:NAD-dependent epimerase/dehydratase family protein n=1 Tax=Candidatus Sungiibacteriota bacterium TaxID=2750080 RepID=A0A932QXN2_9BACT|nr:NAD-dependent epimerase/dehydratase family protein [Candidatus Sungbacteria bacterium]
MLKKPCEAVSIDNYITGSKESFIGEISDPRIRRIEGDITKPLSLEGGADFIVHAAGLASPVYYRKFPLETIDSAIMGAKNLLELARVKNAQSFLFFSSSEIYGDPDPNFIPTPETYRGNVSCIGPRACYDESKRLTETLCMTYHQLYQVPVKIVRPFNVYGPGMKANDYRVVPTFLARGLSGQSLPVHDKGNQTRTFCYISDAMPGFFKVLLSAPGGEVYNVGRDEEEVNMMTLANMVSDLFPGRVRAQLVKYPEIYPADEPQRRCPDLAKIRGQLGYAPQVDLNTGLSRTLAWFRDAMPPAGECIS